MGKRFAIVIGVAAAGVMALGAQTTTAALSSETVKVDSKVTLVVGCPGTCTEQLIHGLVKSSNHACEVERTVKYKKYRRGAPDKLLGRTRPTTTLGGGSRRTSPLQASTTRRCCVR